VRPGGGRFGREIGVALFHALVPARNVRSNLPAETHTAWFDSQDVGPGALSWRLALPFFDAGVLYICRVGRHLHLREKIQGN